jgi:acetyl-CoA carboxylase carboxyl transferase subunit beta
MPWEGFKKIVGRNKKKDLPGGLWTKCRDCGGMIYKKEMEALHRVCPECNYHFPLTSQERIDLLADPGTFVELWPDVESCDPLEFKALSTYEDKIADAKEKTGMKDALLIGTAAIDGKKCMIGVTDSRFIMGSMGSVMGEKIARAFELAHDEKLPVILISGSGGGARMYEGAISLMQMAKTSAAIARHSDAGGLFISIVTHPTMGGVMASFASLGDIILAEPKALIGFAGPRVIKETIKQDLPEGFQTSEFLLEKGFIDRIVNRTDMRQELANMLAYF